MKCIFTSDTGDIVIIGVEPNNTISINQVQISLSEAYKLQRYINTCLNEMEATERKKLPFFKRFLL
jgi:hypothetical protein